ncbi:MAG: DUF559 domain-containing protein [Acidimicrobiales bacterium]
MLRRTGTPRTGRQQALATVLDAGPGAVLSHASAAALWGLPGFQLMATHVSVLRGGARSHPELGIVHRPRALPDRYTTTLDDIPVVRPALLMLQLCASVHPLRAGRALDNAWSRRLLSGPSVARLIDDLARCGRNGIVLLRELIEDRGPSYVPPATGLEARFESILRREGIPAMRRQVDLGDDEDWTGRVDFLGDTLPLVVEVDSETYHGALADAVADARRQERLEGQGFEVVRVTDVMVWHHAGAVAALVRQGAQRATRRRKAA